MRRPLVLSLIAAVLTAAAPAAHADPSLPPPVYGSPYGACQYDTVAFEAVTGGQDTFTGAVWGYAALWDETTFAPLGGTIRCDLTVNGVVAASTPEVHGTGAVATAGQVTIVLGDTDVLDSCLHVVFDDGRVVDCVPTPCEHMVNIEYMDCWGDLIEWVLDAVPAGIVPGD